NAETSNDRFNQPFNAKSDLPWPGAYGISAHLWTESIRTDEQMEYMFFPRLIIYAEQAWHKADWELPFQPEREFRGGITQFVDQEVLSADWIKFANLLGQREIGKLEIAGIAYRVPVPGAKINNGILTANML